MFIFNYGFFSNEDIRWNNFTFTWLDNIQPILQNTEIRLNREKDSWINSLKDKKSKLTASLNDCLSRVKELKQRDKISEGDVVLSDLAKITNEIEKFKNEVNNNKSILNFLIYLLDFI
jgi:peptidoglycan hydrolase CwlO-like protein